MEDPYAFSIMLALKKSFQDFRELDESKGSRYSEWFVTTRDGHSAITKAIDLNMLDAVKYIVSKHPDTILEMNDKFGYPLDYARSLEREDITEYLESVNAVSAPTPAAAAATATASMPVRFLAEEPEGELRVMIFTSVAETSELLDVLCVTARGMKKVAGPEQTTILADDFRDILGAIPGNPCKNEIGVEFVRLGVIKNRTFFVMYKGKGAEVYPYGFIFARPEGTGYFLDLICANQYGGDLLKFFIKWCTAKKQQFIHLHALPQVIGLYTKFGFEFRQGCSSPALPETKAFAAAVKTKGRTFPKSGASVWEDDEYTYVREMVLTLQRRGFSAGTEHNPGCNSPTLSEQGFKDLGCGGEGYTMMRCPKRQTRTQTRKQKKKRTRKQRKPKAR